MCGSEPVDSEGASPIDEYFALDTCQKQAGNEGAALKHSPLFEFSLGNSSCLVRRKCDTRLQALCNRRPGNYYCDKNRNIILEVLTKLHKHLFWS